MARQRTGLSEAELAARLGMKPSEYWDIEFHDDEAFSVFSVSELDHLSVILGVSLHELLFGAAVDQVTNRISYEAIVERLTARMAREELTVEELSDRVGWELAPALSDPTALGQFNVAGLRDVCQAVGEDWVSALPR